MHKTAYEVRISDWSSDVCSSDLDAGRDGLRRWRLAHGGSGFPGARRADPRCRGSRQIPVLRWPRQPWKEGAMMPGRSVASDNHDAAADRTERRFGAVFLIPVVVFLGITVVLGWGLPRDPQAIPPALCGEQGPEL